MTNGAIEHGLYRGILCSGMWASWQLSISMRKSQECFSAGSGKNYVLWMHSLGAGFPKRRDIFYKKNLGTAAGNPLPINFSFRTISSSSAESILVIIPSRGESGQSELWNKVAPTEVWLAALLLLCGQQDPHKQEHILWIPDTHC